MKTSQHVVNNDLEYILRCLNKDFSLLAGRNILITGGAGFLGYYLVQTILFWNKRSSEAQQVKVTVYDNFIRGIPDWLTNLQEERNLTLARHDVTTPLPPDIKDFHYIIHAASIASPTYYRRYPIETMDANVNGLRLLLEYCMQQKEKERPVEGFLFFSSSEVYGDPSPENIPTPETYYGYVSCTGPRSCYDESKRYGETLCVNFARQYAIPVKIARPFTNYGPGLKITDKRVLPDFARDVLAGKDIVMLSDGSPTRTFCYVADAVVGYFKILLKGGRGQAYNIGVEKPEISIFDFALLVAEIARYLFDYKGKVIQKSSEEQNYLADNPNRRCPKIDKAREELQYYPGISLEEGLKRSLIWYDEHRIAEEA